MSKKELLRDLHAENAEWERLLEEIGRERMDEPGTAGAWSIKDVIAHLTAWRRRTVGRLRAVTDGRPEPQPEWPSHLKEDDEINAWFHERDRDRTVDDVLADARRIFSELVDAIKAIPEETLADSSRFPWFEGQPVTGPAFFGHFHEEHEHDMRAAAARIAGRG